MADDIDMANEMIANEVSRRLSELRQISAMRVGTDNCVECGDSMPEPRKKLGFNLCVPCAQEKERKKQLFAG